MKVTKNIEASPKEIEIVQMLANDMTKREIGEQKGWKQRTVQSYAEAARQKFGCRTTVGLVTLFFRNNLIN